VFPKDSGGKQTAFGISRPNELELPADAETGLITSMKWRLPIAGAAIAIIETLYAQGNLVRNGSFENDFADWTPVPSAILSRWPNAPHGDNFALVNRIAQQIPTQPGQAYTLSFYAAADLFISQTATIQVTWGDLPLSPFSTTPRVYNEQINRFEQVVFEKFTINNLTAPSTSASLQIESLLNSQIVIDDIRLIPVPEPSTAAVLFVGAIALAFQIRRKSTWPHPR
jgi:hypothetical protein